MNIGLKIKELRKEKKLTLNDLSQEIKVDSSQLSKIERGVLKPTIGQIREISSFFDTTTDVLLSDETAKELLESKKRILNNKISDQKFLPLIPIDAMAGFGTGEMQVFEHETERFVVPTFKGADYLITVRGSSMYPKYNSGDIIACKSLDINDLFFQWNKVYVLDTEQGALIKRIKQAENKDFVILHSDNKDYSPFDLHRSKINAIAIVMGVIRLE